MRYLISFRLLVVAWLLALAIPTSHDFEMAMDVPTMSQVRTEERTAWIRRADAENGTFKLVRIDYEIEYEVNG